MFWNYTTRCALVLLTSVLAASCTTWEALNTNVPDHAPPPEESAAKPRAPKQITLAFYKKLQRQPLTVAQRQEVERANASGTEPHVARVLKQRVWDEVRKEPLGQLSVQLLSKDEATKAEYAGPTQHTDAQGMVFFPNAYDYFDHMPEAYEVRVDLSSHPFFQEVKFALKEAYTSFPIEPERGSRSTGSAEETEIHVLLNWDGKIVIRIDQ